MSDTAIDTRSNRLLGHQLDGEGDEVVLLANGGMMTFASWEPIAADLRGGYRVLGCDFRGQLRSPGKGHRGLDGHADDLIALLDHLALESVHVLGTSFGAEVGLLLAARHPSRVKTLAAVAAVDRTPPEMPENSRTLQTLARAVLAGGDARAFHDFVIADVYSAAYRRRHAEALAERRAKSEQLPAAWYRGLLGILEIVEDFDLTPALAEIRCPTLVVHAAADAVMPLERVRALAAAIDGAELRIHPESGHGLVLEEPHWLARVYREFLSHHSSPG